MTDIGSYAPSFASPWGGDSSGVVAALAMGRLESTRRILGTSRGSEAVLAFAADGGNAWRPEIGLALLADSRGAHGLAALQFLLACHGNLKVFLEQPEWLYFEGWLTPVQGRCIVARDARSATIDSALGSARFENREGHWSSPYQACGPWSVYPSGGLAPRYAVVTGLRNSAEGFPWVCEQPHVLHRESAGSDPRVEVIHSAWQVILEHAPSYGLWVASTAAGCLLLEQEESRVAQSGSSFDYPGLIAIAPPDCPVFCGEILVHECSHQQLLVYGMLAPMVAADSKETAYSPIKRANRTIDRVLTGAHAVGNMILYYAELCRTMKLDAASRQRYQQHCDWFRDDYRQSLDRSESLTQAGRRLWNSLCVAVDDAMASSRAA